MAVVIDARFHWLPFPGMYQCTLYAADGSVLGEGMGSSKPDAEGHARRVAGLTGK